MTYYAFIQDDKINGCGQVRKLTEGVLNIEITLEQFNNIQDYIWDGENIVIDPDLDAKKLKAAKDEKYNENELKADQKRYMQEFTIEIQDKECVFDTSSQTQTDLLTAFAVCSTGSTYDGWVTNNGVELDLTLEDVALISGTFKELSNVYPTWKHYKELIDNALTVEGVEAIEIDYSLGE